MEKFIQSLQKKSKEFGIGFDELANMINLGFGGKVGLNKLLKKL